MGALSKITQTKGGRREFGGSLALYVPIELPPHTVAQQAILVKKRSLHYTLEKNRGVPPRTSRQGAAHTDTPWPFGASGARSAPQLENIVDPC